MFKKNYHSISDEALEEQFVSLGMPRNLAKTLMYISQIDYPTLSKKDKFCFYNEDYNEDDYNVFIYDTCKYPPNSDSHKTLN